MARIIKEPKTVGQAMANLISAENLEEKQLAKKELEQAKQNLVEKVRKDHGIVLSFKNSENE